MSETIIQTPVSPEDFNKTCLNPQVPLEDRTDCVITSLFFLNFLDKTIATNRSDFVNKLTGLNEEQVIREVYFSNKSKITKMSCYNLPTDRKPIFLNELLNGLKVGNGTIVLFKHETGGHSVAILRNTDDEIVIIDLQVGVEYESLEEIDGFLEEYITVCLLTPTLKRKRNILSPEEKIRKKGVESQKTKKIKLSKRKQTKSIHETRKTKSKRTRTTIKN